jgi:hypothetical protein
MMRNLVLATLGGSLVSCIVSPSVDRETGIEPDVDTDADSDTDSDSDGDTDTDADTEDSPWNANAVSFDFAGAVIGGEIVDGATLLGTTYVASFSVSLMSTSGSSVRTCNVEYDVAGAPAGSEQHFQSDTYWRSWDFSAFPIAATSGECEALTAVFGRDFDDLEAMLGSFQMQMGLENINEVRPETEEDWEKGWGFGDWEEDRPYLAAGALYISPFAAAYEMNVFQAYEMDIETLDILANGKILTPLPLAHYEDAPDGFYQSSPMYVIGTSW